MINVPSSPISLFFQAQSILIKYPLRTHLREALGLMNDVIERDGLGEGRHHTCSRSSCSTKRMEGLVRRGQGLGPGHCEVQGQGQGGPPSLIPLSMSGDLTADEIASVLEIQDGVVTLDECGKTANLVC